LLCNLFWNTLLMLKHIDIVVPVYNEEQSVSVLSADITSVFTQHSKGYSWRCIWVDDGSTDTTALKLKELCTSFPEHNVFLHHTRNFGQSAALMTGFSFCRKDCLIVTLDGDAQNDPADIPVMIDILYNRQVDMVTGVRVNRHDSLNRIISSKIANGFRNLLTGYRVTDSGCAMRVMKSECIRNLVVFKGMHRFLTTLVLMNGFSVIEVPVNHRERKLGKSKYGINNRLWVGLADTFAVLWMKSRLVFPEVKDFSNNASINS
jgi:dolichol-phosphate mannosyltransferase